MATRIDVRVTPIGAAHGGLIDCDLSSPTGQVVNNAIFLPLRSGDFDIVFYLDPNTNLTWDNANPFWSQAGQCPRGNRQCAQFTNIAVNKAGDELTVSATGQAIRSVAHFSLGFTGGNRCDPIIINT